MKKKKGQVLILVLLVVVVALAVGLSVASRNLTNLRITTQGEQSQRAFNAAEGGIEHTLSVLNSGGSVTSSFTVPIGDLTANVGVLENHEYNSVILEGNVGQIKLTGATGGTQLQIEWVKSGDRGEDYAAGGIPASIEITRVDESSPGNFTQARFALTGGSDEASSGKEVGFDNPINCSGDFVKCTRINFSADSRILRIRPFWNQATVKVTCYNVGCSLPLQQYDISSSATSELGLTRKVRVTKTVMPQLPAVFDYVLYSEGDITK